MRLAFLLAALCSACATPTPRAADAKHARLAGCDYDATLVSASPAVMDVVVRCEADGLRGFSVTERPARAHVSEVRTLDGKPLAASDATFELHGARPSIRYRIDLEGVARDAEDFDVALRVNRSLVATASTFLLSPDPAVPGAPLRVRVHVPPGTRFATGLRNIDEGLWEIEAHELRVGTYAVFGDFSLDSIDLVGRNSTLASVSVVTLGGPLALPHATVHDWVLDSAREVGKFWNGFPVPRTLLVLVPVRDRSGVVFGKVLPESAPGVIVVLGEHTTRRELYDDWVLIHELFHLGFPSFEGEGKWLDEGLATYYEPIIRARAGWKSERDVWTEFARDMPQGLAAIEHQGLEHTHDRGVYWGGAIACLLADMKARKISGGKRGLETGLRALLAAGGHASEVWDLDRAIDVIDRELGAPVLEDIARRYSATGRPIEFERLLRELGVRQKAGGIVLDDHAPSATLRRAIVGARREYAVLPLDLQHAGVL